jgi:hypothetical protein
MSAAAVTVGFAIVRTDTRPGAPGAQRHVQKQLPRVFASRDAAETFCALAKKQWPESDFHVSDITGQEGATLPEGLPVLYSRPPAMKNENADALHAPALVGPVTRPVYQLQ